MRTKFAVTFFGLFLSLVAGPLLEARPLHKSEKKFNVNRKHAARSRAGGNFNNDGGPTIHFGPGPTDSFNVEVTPATRENLTNYAARKKG
jgi:hypothetical protein